MPSPDAVCAVQMGRTGAHAVSRILVTGASSGIGRATAAQLVRLGHTVYGSSRHRPEAIEAIGAIPVELDVTDDDSVRRAADEIGPIDVLVNNAGVSHVGAVLDVPVARTRQVLEINLFGVIRTCQAFCPAMPRGGRVINVSSTAGRVGYPFMGGYVASKHALEGLSDVLRRELAPSGIQVVVFAPGTVETEQWDEVAASVDRSARSEQALARFEAMMAEERRRALPVEAVGERLARLCTEASPPPRVQQVPAPLKALLLAKLPARVLDRLFARTLFR